MFSLNLAKGINVIYLKTKEFKGNILDNSKPGLKITLAGGKVLENSAYTADASYDNAIKIAIIATLSGAEFYTLGYSGASFFNIFYFFALNKNEENITDNFPILIKMGIEMKNYLDHVAEYKDLDLFRDFEAGIYIFLTVLKNDSTDIYDGHVLNLYFKKSENYNKNKNLIMLNNINKSLLNGGISTPFVWMTF